MWFDNETFLKIDAEYHRHGLTAMRFLPGNEDFNPSENVWSKFGKDLAIRESEDLKNDKIITNLQFKQKVSQLLTSYGYVSPGNIFSFGRPAQRHA